MSELQPSGDWDAEHRDRFSRGGRTPSMCHRIAILSLPCTFLIVSQDICLIRAIGTSISQELFHSYASNSDEIQTWSKEQTEVIVGWNRGLLTTLFNGMTMGCILTRSPLHWQRKAACCQRGGATGFVTTRSVPGYLIKDITMALIRAAALRHSCISKGPISELLLCSFSPSPDVYNPNAPVFRNIRFIMSTEHWSLDRSSFGNNGHIQSRRASSLELTFLMADTS